MEQWEKNFYISSIAGASNGSSLVVMSKGWYLLCFVYKRVVIDVCHIVWLEIWDKWREMEEYSSYF